MNKLISVCIVLILLLCSNAKAQVRIVSNFINPNSVYAESLLQLNVLNQGTQESPAYLEAWITSSSNEEVIHIRTAMCFLKAGMNVVANIRPTISETRYGIGAQGKFLSVNHYLPSGNYNYCCRLFDQSGREVEDEYCDAFEATTDYTLNLIYPFDRDTILTSNPLLVWMNNEPFYSEATPNEFYKIVVTEMKDKQTAEEALTLNSPTFMLDYLKTHNVQYPFEAKKLEKGSWYAWQVQKINNGAMINSTEVWSFFVKDTRPAEENKYVVMKSEPDAGFFIVTGNKIYFKFDEAYHTDGNLDCKIISEKRDSNKKNKISKPNVLNDKKNESLPMNYKKTGDNRFEINLDALDITSGFHRLEVKNARNQTFTLKFFISE